MTPPSMTPLQKEGSPTCSSATQIFLWPLPSACRTPSSLTTENINTPLGNTGHNSLSVCSSKPGSADLKITLVSQQLILTRIWVNVGGMNGSSFFLLLWVFFAAQGISLVAAVSGRLSIAVFGLLIAVASLVVEQGIRVSVVAACRFNSFNLRVLESGPSNYYTCA